MAIVLGAEEMSAFLDEVFPQIRGSFVIERLDDGGTVVRRIAREADLRPGGTVSGPTIFGAVDIAAYVATMSRIGPEALAVTTNCAIDFMRKPAAGRDLLAEAEVLKLGRQLAVIDVRVRSEGAGDVVARATLTYSIPPKKMG